MISCTTRVVVVVLRAETEQDMRRQNKIREEKRREFDLKHLYPASERDIFELDRRIEHTYHLGPDIGREEKRREQNRTEEKRREEKTTEHKKGVRTRGEQENMNTKQTLLRDTKVRFKNTSKGKAPPRRKAPTRKAAVAASTTTAPTIESRSRSRSREPPRSRSRYIVCPGELI